MASVQSDLDKSMNDEMAASLAYRKRAEFARMAGDEVSAKLWIHIAEEEDGHYNEFKDRLAALREYEERTVVEEPGWIHVKVGATEVRGRKVPSGIEIEQVSSTYDQMDFDRAVKSIEGRLEGTALQEQEPSFQDYANMESMGHPVRTGARRPFPQTYGDWVNLAEDIKTKDKNPETSSQANMMLNTIISEAREPGREPPGDVDVAKRWLVQKADELGIS